MKISDYKTAISYLFSLEQFGIKLGLDNITLILKKLGNPQKDLKFVHVGGTNGKGSVCAMLASVLKEAGLEVGLYTSPHLESFRERIRINGECIPEDSVVALAREFQKIALEVEAEHGAHPTYFEITTAMALKYFSDTKTDLAVMEVGMGGRFDATNVINPEVVVINDISMDHTEYLGDTIEKIAFEKAGIIKPGVPVITSDLTKAAETVINQTADTNKSEVFRFGRDFKVQIHKEDETGLLLDVKFSNTDIYGGKENFISGFSNISVPLAGNFQSVNCGIAATAVALLNKGGLEISEGSFRNGLAKVTWPARIQVVNRNPTIILDSSHNAVSMKNLVETVNKRFSFQKVICVIGIVKEKDRRGIISQLSGLSPEVIAVRPDTHRALDPNILCKELETAGIKCSMIPEVEDGVQHAINTSSENDMIIITGSFYTAGAAMTYLKINDKYNI